MKSLNEELSQTVKPWADNGPDFYAETVKLVKIMPRSAPNNTVQRIINVSRVLMFTEIITVYSESQIKPCMDYMPSYRTSGPNAVP
jgi:hypothetical protein